MADYLTRNHFIWNHRTMRPILLKPTRKYTENSKYRKNKIGRGFSGTSNTGVTQKTDNPLKEIRNLVPNRTHNHWPRVLAVLY